jgi:hypothetical protein
VTLRLQSIGIVFLEVELLICPQLFLLFLCGGGVVSTRQVLAKKNSTSIYSFFRIDKYLLIIYDFGMGPNLFDSIT